MESPTTQKQSNNDKESLLTTKALQLSLSPPRCPPFNTAHRSVLAGLRPLNEAYHVHIPDAAHSDYNLHSGVREGLMHLIANADLSHSHPHMLLGPEGADQVTRFLGSLLPLSWQNHIRDSGGFRSIFNTLVEYSIPVGAATNPKAALSFLRLTRRCRTIHYGNHASQFIDLYVPDNSPPEQWAGMVFFVHGGAWGSGKPWYYRLVAQSFLDLNLAVAIVGYRVYPDADTTTQVADLESAMVLLTKEYPDLCGPRRVERSVGFCVVGHSSGAHIAMLFVVEQIKRLLHSHLEGANLNDKIMTDVFVGISGPYDINHHFDYEAGRGVEELSPMKACNGYTRELFRYNSPTWRLRDFLTTFPEGNTGNLTLNSYFPRTLLLHGIEDDTVPFTATGEAAKALRSCGIDTCDEYYAPLTGHQDAVMHLMFGGRVKDYIQTWLTTNKSTAPLRSRL